jgi:hypothetical protein
MHPAAASAMQAAANNRKPTQAPAHHLAAPLAHAAAAAAAAAGHGRVQRGGGTCQQAPDSRLQKRPWAPHHEGWDSKGPAWVPAHIPLLEEHAADGQEGAAALFALGGCLCSFLRLGGAAPTAHSAELRIGLGMSTREPALQCCQWARVPPILPPSPNGTGMHARHSTGSRRTSGGPPAGASH